MNDESLFAIEVSFGQNLILIPNKNNLTESEISNQETSIKAAQKSWILFEYSSMQKRIGKMNQDSQFVSVNELTTLVIFDILEWIKSRNEDDFNKANEVLSTGKIQIDFLKG